MKLTRRTRRRRKRKLHLKDKALEELEDLVEQNVIFKSKKSWKEIELPRIILAFQMQFTADSVAVDYLSGVWNTAARFKVKSRMIASINCCTEGRITKISDQV